MGPGQEASLTAPCSNLRCFRSKCTVEESTLRYCWDCSAPSAVIRRPRKWFGAPIVIRRLGNCAPFPPSLRPWSSAVHSIDFPMECMAWRFWMMRQCNGCTTPASRSDASKRWIERTANTMKTLLRISNCLRSDSTLYLAKTFPWNVENAI